MDKKQLRQFGKDKLLSITDEARKEISKSLVQELLGTELWKQAETIGVTVSGGLEWDTIPLIQQGWKEGKRIVVPKCIPEVRRLDFYQLENFDQLEDSFYNLKEPNPNLTSKVEKQAIDLLIVPGLLYDKRGYRIGFGGGYYDRFLVNYPNQTVSICYKEQLIEEIPNEAYDIAIQNIITEEGLVS